MTLITLLPVWSQNWVEMIFVSMHIQRIVKLHVNYVKRLIMLAKFFKLTFLLKINATY